MDAIEQRLTTDVTGAQAVVDLGGIIRNAELDHGGRPANLVRIGLVLDALSRYLVDCGAMLYGVVGRSLLSDQSLTSKERMVLGRWTDEGLIEVTPTVGDRVVEVADLTGLPVITTHPYPDLAKRFGWLADGSGRVLLLTHRAGRAALRPMDDPTAEPAPGEDRPEQVVGRASIPGPDDAGNDQATAKDHDEGQATAKDQDEGQATAEDRDEEAAEPSEEPAESEEAEPAESDQEAEPAESDEEAAQAPADQPAGERAADQPAGNGARLPLPLPVEVFADRGAARVTRTRISWRRFRRAEPSRPALLRRRWRCDGFECPAFGEHRRIGQPVPRMRGEVPTCPRHDQPVVDAGAREPGYAVSIVVDDLPRRRLMVRGGQPVRVGRAGPDAPDGATGATGGPDTAPEKDPEVISVALWLHQAAAAWVGPVHIQLEATEEGLVVTDLSENGTVVWQREGPDDPGTARPLHRDAYQLGEWDSVELYTGIELVRADRRLTAVLGRDEFESVLVDAPTAAHQQVSAGPR